MGSPRPPPLRRGGLLRFETAEVPAAEARGPSSLRFHQDGGLRVFARTTPAVRSLVEDPAHGRLRQKCRALGREGGSGHGPSPRVPPAKRHPVGSTWRLRAHTRETASPFPWGGGGPCRKWSRRSASPPSPCPWGVIRLPVGRGCMHVVRTRRQGEETKRRADAMMLSRTGWDVTPLPVARQTVEGRRAPWGCAAGAPYRGTASPPPPPPTDNACASEGDEGIPSRLSSGMVLPVFSTSHNAFHCWSLHFT